MFFCFICIKEIKAVQSGSPLLDSFFGASKQEETAIRNYVALLNLYWLRKLIFQTTYVSPMIFYQHLVSLLAFTFRCIV